LQQQLRIICFSFSVNSTAAVAVYINHAHPMPVRLRHTILDKTSL